MKHNYEKGGQVKISDQWITLDEYLGVLNLPNAHGNGYDLKLIAVENFIQDYKPPKQEDKPFEWVHRRSCSSDSQLNKHLTDQYGDPTERVYNGEDASEFGLKNDTGVLYWEEDGEYWRKCFFKSLDKGDLRRKQPKRLTEL